MQSSRTPRKSCKARRRVQHSLLMRLQDAMTGPPVILSFKKPIRVFDRVRRGAATSSGQSRTLAWPSLGHPSRAPRRVRCLCFPLPRSSDPPRAPRNSLAPSRGTSLSTAHRHAVDATPSNKDERRCKPARKLGPPSSARGANSSHKKVQSGLVVRGALGVVLDQVRREPLHGVRGSFFHERRHPIEQNRHDGRVEVRPNGQGLDVHGVLDVVVGLQGGGDVGRIRGLDLRDGGGGFVAASRRVSCVCFVAATASRGRPCRARGP